MVIHFNNFFFFLRSESLCLFKSGLFIHLTTFQIIVRSDILSAFIMLIFTIWVIVTGGLIVILVLIIMLVLIIVLVIVLVVIILLIIISLWLSAVGIIGLLLSIRIRHWLRIRILSIVLIFLRPICLRLPLRVRLNCVCPENTLLHILILIFRSNLH